MEKAISLTEQQEAVISNRGGTLLVSAAAGAGKTKVLVDRIVNRICTENMDITDFLIITYTRAAAAELRAKITAELSKRVADNPGDTHIQKQLHKVYSAQISTVHAFCSNVLRANAAAAGVPSDFRIGEEQECRTLKGAAMEALLESVYKDIDKAPNIHAFVEELAFGRDDSAVPAILYNIYDTIQAHPWPEKWVAECISQMNVASYADAGETPWGRYILNDIKNYVRSQMSLVSTAQEICDSMPALSAAYSSTLAADLMRMNGILKAETWDGLYTILSQPWARLGRIKKGEPFDESAKCSVKELRDRYKKAVDSKGKSLYGPSAETLEDLTKTEAPIRGMFDMVKDFTVRYQERKQTHGILDYNDLEHKTIQLLLDSKTGERTSIADSIGAQFKEILVDEYQDSNSVQETIFTAIERSGNRFMVGDVKQCIYMFRLADPTIFLKHYRSFKSYQEAGEGEARKIVLTKNFRSRPEILDATNEVMRACMSQEVGGLEYDDEEALVPGRTDFPVADNPVVSLDIINMDTDDNLENTDDDGEALVKVDAEAKHVASRIHDMLSSETIFDEATGTSRPVQPSDIAILLRSTKTPAKHYAKALNELGIAVKSAKSGSLMDTTEIATLFCFMQILDNPSQDIPLVAVLASPLAGFSADELAAIRIVGKKNKCSTFYSSLCLYAETNAKAKSFLQQLMQLRAIAPHTALTQLFYEVVMVTDAEDVFGSMENGEQRMANIHAFADSITGYDANGAHGLFEFICYIEELREQGVDLTQPTIGAIDNAVSIMSIHASKGLEFPVVFLADLSRRFNQGDLKGSVLLHKKLGAGVQVMDKRLRYRYPTIARSAIAACMSAETKSEELRILYVAMTRAKQRLVMSYCEKLHRTLPKMVSNTSYPLLPAISQGVTAPGEWIIMTALTRAEAGALRAHTGTLIRDIHKSDAPWDIQVSTAEEIAGKRMTMAELEADSATETSGELPDNEPFIFPNADLLESDINFEYKFQAAIHTPTKVTATAQRTEKKPVRAPSIHIDRPGFIKGKGGFTSAERGTATHLFMQHANFAACVKGGRAGVDAELARMVGAKFLSVEQAQAVIKDCLYTLFESDVGKELAALDIRKTKREFPFSILVKASEFLGSEASDDEILLQGIIDLHTEEKDGLIVYDFKSDYVETAADEEEKAKEYATQLSTYASALSRIYQQPVLEKNLIFLRTGHKVAV